MANMITSASVKYDICFPESEVSRVSFFLMGNEEHAKASNCNVISKDLFSNDRPLDAGIYSLSMGTTSYSYRCKTCQNTRDKCPGHFGAVQLRYPVINPLFRGEIFRWLRQVCHFCGAALGKIAEDGSFKASTSNKTIVCANCNHEQLTLLRDPKEPLYLLKSLASGEEVRVYNDEIETIFSRVSAETAATIGNGKFHPSSLLLRTVPAVPNNARPDVRKLKSSTRSNNNDTTTFIKSIVATNEMIPLLLADEEKETNENLLNLLEVTYSNMVRDPSGTSASSRIVGGNNHQLTSLGARLRGKEGRIRGNLEGKRFQHGDRSVISGDNFIDIDEVGIPIAIAKVLQVPEVVRPYNINRLMTYFLNKNTTYPGGNFGEAPCAQYLGLAGKSGCKTHLRIAADRLVQVVRPLPLIPGLPVYVKMVYRYAEKTYVVGPSEWKVTRIRASTMYIDYTYTYTTCF